MTALLLKGVLRNFLHASETTCGANRWQPSIHVTYSSGAPGRGRRRTRGAKALLYITRNEYNGGGIALYGVLMEPEFLEEQY